MNNPRQDEFIQPQALNMPSLIRDNTEDGGYQKMLDELATPYKTSAPSLSNVEADPYLVNDPAPIVEHESLPTLSILEQNKDVAHKWNGGLYE